MRGTIAERMAASLDTMAQLTLDMSADLDAVVALREELADEMPADARPGYTDFVIAAAARALRQHPVVNSQVRDDHLELLPDVHVGMAVAVEDGLIVPVIEYADTLPVTDLSVETSRLATAARDRLLSLDELSGGTFSVTALGMFGVDSFTPVINPPNTAVLGIGRLRDDTVWDSGSPRPARRLTLSLTWDHRAFDGAPAASFCRTICEILAEPRQLLPT
jgi:pyruvate dehydrogenase E2 component (dihydrolipoamide acetyltransferase)